MIQGNRERALDCYKRTAALMPSFARPTVKMAALLLQRGNANEAQQALVTFLIRNPRDVSAGFALARSYELTHDHAAALREYRALLNLRLGNKMNRLIEDHIAALQEQNK